MNNNLVSSFFLSVVLGDMVKKCILRVLCIEYNLVHWKTLLISMLTELILLVEYLLDLFKGTSQVSKYI